MHVPVSRPSWRARLALVAGLTSLAASPVAAAEEPTPEALVQVLQAIDERQRSYGDYRASVFIEQKEHGKDDVDYDAVVYRRDKDEMLVILFVKPKAEAGKGYLRIDKNLFFYDSTVGRWERRTEREHIGGTGSRRADFDQSRLASEYTPTFVGEEKLGSFDVLHLKLGVKPGVDVAYPVMHIWVDRKTTNLLKAQDFALSGRLMRTTYYPKWEAAFSAQKKAEVYFPKEIRIYDEVEKGTSTLVVIRQVELQPLPANIFTKAWLETRSR